MPLKEIPSISLIDDKLPEQKVRTDFELPTQPPRVDKEAHNVVSHYQWQSTDCDPFFSISGMAEFLMIKLVAEAENYILDNDVLYHFHSVRAKGVLPGSQLVRHLANPTEFRDDILQCYHDSPGGSHLAFEKCFASIRAKYFWPRMWSDIQSYIKSCDACQKATRNYANHKAPLQPMPVSEPFMRVHMDILGPLTETPDGNKYILFQ